MKMTFEEYVILIERWLGIHLRYHQKEVLRAIYEEKPFYYRSARGVDMTTLEQAVILLMLLKGEDENV